MVINISIYKIFSIHDLLINYSLLQKNINIFNVLIFIQACVDKKNKKVRIYSYLSAIKTNTKIII